jgi:hypothetical protein
MNNQFETTFIPQQPILRVEGASRSGEPVNFALILSLVVFFVTIGISVGAYLYRNQVELRVLEKGKILQAAENDFNIDEISTYKRIDSRLSLAKKLVDEHVISSAIFSLIESSVAQNVGLTSFSFDKDSRTSGSSGGDSVTLAGQAPSYAAVYFQVESWRALRPQVQSVEVTSMNLDDKSGVVGFSAVLTIDPSYSESLRVIEANSAAAKRQAEASASNEVSSTASVTTNISPP